MVVWSRMSECLLRRSSPCPVSACPRVRCPRVQWRVCRCPVCGRPVSARLVSAFASAPGCVRGASVRRARAPWLGRFRLRRGHPPRLRAARLFARAGRGRAGGGRTGRGSRLRTWPPSRDALGRWLRPRSPAWPTRDSRLRAGRPSGWLGITGRGAGCARRSPTRCMSSCVSSGAGSSAGGPHEVLDQGGDYGAWSLDGVGPESPGSGRAGGFDCEKGARPHRGPGMQRARPGRGWQGSDLQELWWARQGLNLRLLPCQGSALPLSYAPVLPDHTAVVVPLRPGGGGARN